ncbi:NYN domain-containing protein [Thauera sinica]|uniref:NYN domain-containing protein n=1 Tax=Thauera sinica TaxID=2665146 RepID=A0ABW1AXS1_9RHOO|nr:NYN domain-containing protein [Thauera sp. K11]ATE60211.1 hypothetical protein CCZ27_09825 [Thauera sp. K11]
MASPSDSVSMALFCDFENVALGVRDANYEKFDIKRVLERLLLKGSIVVKKAYCDWDRYKSFKASMHEANFELIEIPHVRQSGKNSADIRLVVDALDLCYTKSHVDTFVIISGDSDFSPLVSKLRENAKQVIGVGVKQSTSDLLIANCDEFIFYDDLVRESQRAAKKEAREAQSSGKRSPEEDKHRREEVEARKSQAIEFAVHTFDALYAERGDTGKIWASVLKEAMKRRKPDFSESYYGFRAFGNLLEEARARGLLDFARDEKARTYVFRGNAEGGRVENFAGHPAAEPAEIPAKTEAGRRRAKAKSRAPADAEPQEHVPAEAAGEAAPSAGHAAPGTDVAAETGAGEQAAAAEEGSGKRRKSGAARGGTERKRTRKNADEAGPAEIVPDRTVETAPAAAKPRAPAKSRAPAKPRASAAPAGHVPAIEHAPVAEHTPAAETPEPASAATPAEVEAAPKKPRKPASRGRRPRKPELPPDASQ